jgi:poly-gamma-glutamate capsule biosynthesis protein CapA/YwtB (metallophosphatase superfamily)
LKIAFTGDIMPQGEVGERIKQDSLAEWLSGVAPAWCDADVLIGNLESPCVVAAKAVPKKRPELEFRAPASRVRELAEAGFTAVTLANNHVLDCGPDGLRETLQALDDAGIRHTGAGMNLDEALRPVLLPVGGKVLGIVAFSYGPAATTKRAGGALCDRKTMARGLSLARESCDVLVAALHDGLEYSDLPPRRTRARFRFMAENGADIVIGHHPHVLQGMEWIGGVPIAFSLGDFLSYNSIPAIAKRNFARMDLPVREPGEVRRDPEKFARGAVLTIEISGSSKVLEWHPFRQDSDARPRLCSGETLTGDLERLDALSKALCDEKDPRQAMADRVMEACIRESRAAVQWRDLPLLARRPKWRYIPRGFAWLAGRLKKAVLGV